MNLTRFSLILIDITDFAGNYKTDESQILTGKFNIKGGDILIPELEKTFAIRNKFFFYLDKP
ncbi:unnamed protein product, partial [marine sediment metagenome]